MQVLLHSIWFLVSLMFLEILFSFLEPCSQPNNAKGRPKIKRKALEGWRRKKWEQGYEPNRMSGGYQGASNGVRKPCAPEGNISVSTTLRFQVHSSICFLIMLIILQQSVTYCSSWRDICTLKRNWTIS